MNDHTGIEWTDATWNPVTGCTKVSAGCKNCYAERIFKRPYPDREFTDVWCHPERLYQPLHWRKPQRIFVNSMSDLFHESVPFFFISQVFEIMEMAERHTFQILTKRPKRALEFMVPKPIHLPVIPRRPLPNVWLGVSVEDQKTADERIPLLIGTPAAVRFVSYEPALSPVIFQGNGEPGIPTALVNRQYLRGVLGDRRIAWVICGGESGPHARPMHPDWARSVRDQCQAAGVPFFFKQWGEWMPVLCGIDPNDGDPHCRIKDFHLWEDGQNMWKVGKKAAGCLLDGQEWNEFPSTT